MVSRSRAARWNKRVRLFKQQDGICYYCGRPMLLEKGDPDAINPPELATLDHLRTRAAGGTWADTNIVVACLSCNNERGSMRADRFRAKKRELA